MSDNNPSISNLSIQTSNVASCSQNIPSHKARLQKRIRQQKRKSGTVAAAERICRRASQARRRKLERNKPETVFDTNNKCTICLNVFFRPVILVNCFHIFCELCIQQ